MGHFATTNGLRLSPWWQQTVGIRPLTVGRRSTDRFSGICQQTIIFVGKQTGLSGENRPYNRPVCAETNALVVNRCINYYLNSNNWATADVGKDQWQCSNCISCRMRDNHIQKTSRHHKDVRFVTKTKKNKETDQQISGMSIRQKLRHQTGRFSSAKDVSACKQDSSKRSNTCSYGQMTWGFRILYW